MSGRVVLAVVILALLAAVILYVMARSWRAGQVRSTAALPALPQPPATLGAARTGVLEGVYVTSTSAGDQLDRVHGHGLGARSPAQVQVHEAGVVISRPGATDLFVPAVDVLDVGRASGMAGKVVGGDRLVVLRWRLGDGPQLDTGLHLRHPAERDLLTDALRALVDAYSDANPDENPGTTVQAAENDVPTAQNGENA